MDMPIYIYIYIYILYILYIYIYSHSTVKIISQLFPQYCENNILTGCENNKFNYSHCTVKIMNIVILNVFSLASFALRNLI